MIKREMVFRLLTVQVLTGCYCANVPNGDQERERSMLRPMDSLHIVARQDSLVVALMPDTAGLRGLSVGRAQDGRFVSLGTTYVLAPWEPVPDTRFVQFADSALVLVHTFDAPAEGSVGTMLYTITDSARQIYSDPELTCRPSELQFLGAEESPQLVRFRREDHWSDCMHSCAEYIREDLKFEPAWPVLLGWNGATWVEADATSAYYANFAADLQRVHALVQDDPEGSAQCPELLFLLTRWRARVDSIVRNQ